MLPASEDTPDCLPHQVLIDPAEVVRGRLDPIAQLRAIPIEHVRAMQRTIGAHGHRMQYAAVDTALLDTALLSRSATATVADARDDARAAPDDGASRLPDTALPDAFDIALSRAWERATDRSTIEAGRRTQRVEGAALEAGLDSFDLEPKFGSWGGPNTGTCMRTWGFPGDCERGAAGTWALGLGSRDDISPHGLWSLEDCSERCRRCARCRWYAVGSHCMQVLNMALPLPTGARAAVGFHSHTRTSNATGTAAATPRSCGACLERRRSRRASSSPIRKLRPAAHVSGAETFRTRLGKMNGASTRSPLINPHGVFSGSAQFIM